MKVKIKREVLPKAKITLAKTQTEIKIQQIHNIVGLKVVLNISVVLCMPYGQHQLYSSGLLFRDSRGCVFLF